MFTNVLLICLLVLPATSDLLPECGVNETRKYCGTACEPSCNIPEPMVCTKQCLLNICQCSDGFVRDHNVGKCVKLEDCSKDQ